MGLTISVGLLAGLNQRDAKGAQVLRDELRNLNDLLQHKGLRPHAEPEELPKLRSRNTCASFPYSYIHYLRRVAARRRLEPGFVAEPLADGEDPTDDPAIRKAGGDLDFHLIDHSDCDGFYVPQDFGTVLLATRERPVFGEGVGSSVRLYRELVEVAPALGIQLAPDGSLSDEEAQRITDDLTTGPLHRESIPWLALYEAARLSLAHNTLIVFDFPAASSAIRPGTSVQLRPSGLVRMPSEQRAVSSPRTGTVSPKARQVKDIDVTLLLARCRKGALGVALVVLFAGLADWLATREGGGRVVPLACLVLPLLLATSLFTWAVRHERRRNSVAERFVAAFLAPDAGALIAAYEALLRPRVKDSPIWEGLGVSNRACAHAYFGDGPAVRRELDAAAGDVNHPVLRCARLTAEALAALLCHHDAAAARRYAQEAVQVAKVHGIAETHTLDLIPHAADALEGRPTEGSLRELEKGMASEFIGYRLLCAWGLALAGTPEQREAARQLLQTQAPHARGLQPPSREG